MSHKHRFVERIWLQGYPHLQCHCGITKAVPLGIDGQPVWPTDLEQAHA